ncbi:MAG: PQQ-binding-like beta-propeller repeat protein [Candidatus Aureabacteria bacterium]|nr:PQQ-binding-like beta-propeller repeat protein [Candidatus Auribacterota bacterium]
MIENNITTGPDGVCNTSANYTKPRMFHHDPLHRGRVYIAGPSVPVLAWSYRTADSVESSVAVGSDGALYVGSDDNLFYAFYPTGELAWSYVTEGDISSSPAINATQEVYIGSEDNRFYAFNSMGGLEWSYAHPGGTAQDFWASSPVINAVGEVYIQARTSLVVFDSIGALAWSFSTGAASTAHHSSPAVGSDGRIYWGTGDLDRLYAINSDRTLAWSYLQGGTLQSSPSINGGGQVYMGAYDNNLYVYASTGALSWSYLTGDDIYSSTAIDASDNAYVGSRDNYLYTFTSVGALYWSYAAAMDIDSSPVIDIAGMVYTGAQDNMVYALDSNGTLIWSYVSGSPFNASPAIGCPYRVYAGSLDNNIYALGATRTFTLYGDADGEVNRVSVPLNNTGIETTVDLGNSIGAAFSPEVDDTIVISRMIASTQTLETTTGTYDGAVWGWDPLGGYSIVVGEMYKATITLAGGSSQGKLIISGTVPPAGSVVFDLYDLSGSNDNDNWISLPFDKGDLATTEDVGESIAAEIEAEEGDTIEIALWDVENQVEITTTGAYVEEAWSWDPSGGYAVWAGMPFIVRPYRDGGMPTITWP